MEMEVNTNESINTLFDSLDEWLNDENRIVTYRSVSVTFSLHVNYAKYVLEEFAKSERAKNRRLSVTYCIAGRLAGDDSKVYKVIVVPEELKEETKASMLSPVTCHIYSIQNCPLKTADMLYMADFDLLKSAGIDANRFSAVRCPSAKLTQRTVTADISSSSTAQKAAASTLTAPSSSDSSQGKVSEVKKAAEKTTQSKASTGIGRLFGNVAKKQQSAADDKKAASSGDGSRSSEVGENRSRSPGSSENVAASKSKPDASKKVTSPRSASSKAVGDSRTKVADASKTAHKQSGQTKNKTDSGKRRRIVSISSSDEEDDEVLEPSSPELIVLSPPQQAVTEPEPMEVVAAPPATDNSAEPQYMQRKLVSKTYVNEEGYMVTEKVWQSEMVAVSAGEDSTKQPVVQPPSAPPPQTKKQPAKKTPPKSSCTKQASLTKFFQKK